MATGIISSRRFDAVHRLNVILHNTHTARVSELLAQPGGRLPFMPTLTNEVNLRWPLFGRPLFGRLPSLSLSLSNPSHASPPLPVSAAAVVLSDDGVHQF